MKKSLVALAVLLIMASAALAQVPAAGHVYVVVEENHGYTSIVGNSSLPYLNGLANQYGLATNYYGNTHPSIGNYLMMTTGQIITNSDGYSSNVSAANMVRTMMTAGVTWKSYAESLPSVGYTGGDVYPYVKHHNPFAYFTDVVNSSNEKLNVVPFTQFKTDITNNAVPRFSFIVPNMHHNGHDCPDGMTSCTDSQKKAAMDNWLKTNIAPILANPQFQQDGLLVITFDEGSASDTTHGGGHLATVVIGPKVKKNHKSSTLYQHQNLLRTMLNALGVTSNLPGVSSTAPAMSDFFGASAMTTPPAACTMSTVSPSVTICSPTANTTVPTTVNIVAGTTSATAISALQIYLDGVKVFQTNTSSLVASVAMTAGTHRLTVQAKDVSGLIFKQTIYVTAQ